MKKWTVLLGLVFLYCLASAQTNLKVGAPAPEITVTEWLLNVPADTSLANKNIVLEFWATWCVPCLEAVPHLNELQARFASPDLRFLSITYEPPEVARKVFDRVDFHSVVVTDESGQTQIGFGDGKKGLTYYPLTVLIDKERTIRWYGSPKDLDEAMMERFLNREEVHQESELTERLGEGASSMPLPAFIDQKTFSDLFGDSTLTWMVHLQELGEKPEERSASLFMPGYSGGFDACISLQDLFRKLFPHKRFVLPPDLASRHFNFAYLNKKPSLDSEPLLQSALLERLDLETTVRLEPAHHFFVSVRDPGALVTDKTALFSSYKYDEAGNLVFTKYAIADMLAVLSEQTDHTWTFQGTGKGKYAFSIDLSSEKAMRKSLKRRGLTVRKKAGKIETVYLTYTHPIAKEP